MAKQKQESFCGPAASNCCRVESVVTVDERGQMVLPKELRERARIAPGEKLALVTWDKGDAVCCIFLIKANDFAGMVKNMLGPMVKELINE